MRETLSPEQAEKLLAPVGPVLILDISVAATTNDVFKIRTQDHGSYYVKLHTARWYSDQPDTFFVVERECAVHELLRKRGIPLPYQAWADYTRTVVPRSVFVCGELPGIPVSQAVVQFPDEQSQILHALGCYMRRLHDIEFARPGLLAYAHAYFAPAQGTVPPVYTWDRHPMHHAEHLQADALDVLERKRAHLPGPVAESLKQVFSLLADTVRADYIPPRFTVGNCHAWHFHVGRYNGEWRVEGFYDLEAASAGDSNIDLAELEITLTPALGSTAWRDPFFDGYGSWPGLEGYKRRLLYYLLFEVGEPSSRMIPDIDWMNRQWRGMINATGWTQLGWYPDRKTELEEIGGIP